MTVAERQIEGHPGAAEPPRAAPTVWGLTIAQLHDRFWASRGVQVMRLGRPSTIVDNAELFLLTDPRVLVAFSIRQVVEKAVWMRPDLLIVRLRNTREAQYREAAVCAADGTFIRYQRSYGGWDARLARVCFTRDKDLARDWLNAQDVRAIWREFRRKIRQEDRLTVSLRGRVYDGELAAESAQFVRDLVADWKRPDTTINGIVQASPGVWAWGGEGANHGQAAIEPGTEFIGPVWIGAGRVVGKGTGEGGIFGPAALWDEPAARPVHDELEWEEIEPRDVLTRRPEIAEKSGFYERTKRAFDIFGALLGLLATLWMYPVVMLATLIEDGYPFFYGQKRETRGGREFNCWKFRSMRRDADKIKARLAAENQADGPQFFMKHDPRLTRVGRFIRKYNIDELPQFWNVLIGDMSIVGPRPSPRAENQFCPPWREARLSVRPGITGLWQVKRTRRQGMDFQEWIKFDLEYVKRAGWRLDLWILVETVRVLTLGPRT